MATCLHLCFVGFPWLQCGGWAGGKSLRRLLHLLKQEVLVAWPRIMDVEKKAWRMSTVFSASDDTKKKMYSSILVVGGGLMFHKAQEFLQHRILNKMPPSFRRIIENVDVITRPKVGCFIVQVGLCK